MAEGLFLIALLAVGSFGILRTVRRRQRRRLREAWRRRRAEEKRRWEEMTGQFLGEDWRP